MDKNCIYCGVHFTSKSHSKKYCSDKQMAYFKRNGLILSSHCQTLNVKCERLVKTESVKYVCPSSGIVKYETPSLKKAIVKSSIPIVNNKDLDELMNCLTKEMDRRIYKAIEKVKQELTAK